MAKSNWAPGPWTIIRTAQRSSKYHDNGYTYVTMKNEQGQTAHTNIEADFGNNANWQQVLEAVNDDNTVVIDDVFYKTKSGKIVLDTHTNQPVIDADSRPSIKSIVPDPERQLETEQRRNFNQDKLQSVIDSGIEYKNGRWDITPYMNKDGVFAEELNPSKTDNIDVIREKLRLKSLIRYADMLNRGFHGNS